MREVDPGAEDALAGVARVIDDRAAQHADLGLGIEQDQVDGRLGRAERGAVLGVEVALVAELEHGRTPLPRDARGAEVGEPGAAELVDELERDRRRSEHRLDQVAPGLGQRQHVRDQQTLRELEPALVGQRQRALGLHLGVARAPGPGPAPTRR